MHRAMHILNFWFLTEIREIIEMSKGMKLKNKSRYVSCEIKIMSKVIIELKECELVFWKTINNHLQGSEGAGLIMNERV